MQEQVKPDERVWLSASEALSKAAGACGDRVSAKARLADLLKDGKVRARAARMWTSKRPTLTAAWQARSRAKFETDVVLSPMIWGRSRHWLDDLELWRWSRNRFVITASQTPPERIILEGIQFDERDIERELPPIAAVAPPPKRGAGGRPIKRDEWHLFWLAVLARSQKGELSRGIFESQVALREALLADITPDKGDGTPYLSAEAIKPHVKDIWDTYLAPQN